MEASGDATKRTRGVLPMAPSKPLTVALVEKPLRAAVRMLDNMVGDGKRVSEVGHCGRILGIICSWNYSMSTTSSPQLDAATT